MKDSTICARTQPRGQGQGRDPFGPVALRHRFRQVDQRCAGRAIGHGVRGIAALPRPAGHVQDAPAALLAKRPDDAFCQIGGGQKMHPECARPDGLPLVHVRADGKFGADGRIVSQTRHRACINGGLPQCGGGGRQALGRLFVAGSWISTLAPSAASARQIASPMAPWPR